MRNFFDWNFSVGSISGIPLKIHFFFPLLGAIWLAGSSNLMELGINAAWVAGLLVSVVLHELGHAWAAQSVGGSAREILIWPLGGLAFVSHSGGLKEELKVTAAGPLMHLPIAAVCLAYLAYAGVPVSWALLSPEWVGMPTQLTTFLVAGMLKMQSFLFLFNMFVPAYPMDGGRLLVTLLLMANRSIDQVYKTIFASSLVVAVALILVFPGFTAMWIGLFVLVDLWQLYQFKQQGALPQHPLFGPLKHSGPGRPAARPKKKRHLRLVSSSGRTCPYCNRSLPEKAQMCGFCERVV